MIQTLFHRLGIAILLVLLQVFVLNHINLWGYAIPLLGVMALFYTPLSVGRISGMLHAFVIGIVLDAFSNTPGVAAGAMTLTAFIQPSLLMAMAPKDALTDAVPNKELLGRHKYFWYIALLMAVHHLAYFMLEAFTFFNFSTLLLRLLGSYLLSLLLVFTMEMLRSSKS